ncbi:hypothetical protein Rsub_07454 [Raphidocelis subcapitata]|uniref:Uncharacterized protein n=1 Tax=Raphidocelis subcapitata TaxID=307507 RepID=A0A2V0PAM1_9CHLO|nr:hypothetical protein Rsub_07454 [Raphidocelis subcapitata]|eukprot:GBF94953.1 hypothetical protein Rsub_07454 [Raphidocelis subcapitata]
MGSVATTPLAAGAKPPTPPSESDCSVVISCAAGDSGSGVGGADLKAAPRCCASAFAPDAGQPDTAAAAAAQRAAAATSQIFEVAAAVVSTGPSGPRVLAHAGGERWWTVAALEAAATTAAATAASAQSQSPPLKGLRGRRARVVATALLVSSDGSRLATLVLLHPSKKRALTQQQAALLAALADVAASDLGAGALVGLGCAGTPQVLGTAVVRCGPGLPVVLADAKFSRLVPAAAPVCLGHLLRFRPEAAADAEAAVASGGSFEAVACVWHAGWGGSLRLKLCFTPIAGQTDGAASPGYFSVTADLAGAGDTDGVRRL